MGIALDQKINRSVSFVINLIESRKRNLQGHESPYFLGLSGIQGAGKTTLVAELCQVFSSEPYNLNTLTLSIDDLYLPHIELLQVAKTNPNNPLLQHRGLPGTHDIDLALTIFSALRRGGCTRMPRFDKSAYSGHGDRMNEFSWTEVNKRGESPIDLVIIEGWCIGFKPLLTHELERRWREAVIRKESESYEGRLGYLKLGDIQLINDYLCKYEQLTNQLDALIHVDAENTKYVYQWRQDQENVLRHLSGSAMSVEEVNAFVDNYYAAYELYLPALRDGIFDNSGKQLRLVLDKQRQVIDISEL